MNLKNRLKRLEGQTGVNSEFCGCFGRGAEVYIQAADAKQPELITPAIPDLCEKCGKPVNSVRIIIQGV